MLTTDVQVAEASCVKKNLLVNTESCVRDTHCRKPVSNRSQVGKVLQYITAVSIAMLAAYIVNTL